MSASDLALLIHFILQGIQAIKTFISDKEVRDAFEELKTAETDEARQLLAAKLAAIIYRS